MSHDLVARLTSYVRDHPGHSAREIARALGIERGEANSVLYRLRGQVFTCTSDPPPRWSLTTTKVQGSQGSLRLVQEIVGEAIHVDLPGGDWLLTIQVGNMSINDPIALVESGGRKVRTITVSHQVVEEGANSTSFHAVLAIAASMLAWEASEVAREEYPHIPFEFETAVRDIYLSAAAHVQLRRQSAQS